MVFSLLFASISNLEKNRQKHRYFLLSHQIIILFRSIGMEKIANPRHWINFSFIQFCGFKTLQNQRRDEKRAEKRATRAKV